MNKIEVIRTNDGKKPIFLGDRADTAHRIREKCWKSYFQMSSMTF